MKTVYIILTLFVFCSFAANAQSSKADSLTYYLNASGNAFMVSDGFGLASAGMAILSTQYQNQSGVLLTGAGIFAAVAIIEHLRAGNYIRKAGLLKLQAGGLSYTF